MIEAEIQGKVAPTEDILTSSIFGILKYKFMRGVLLEFLGRARRYSENDKILKNELIKHHALKETATFLFWKRFDKYHSIPDLIIKDDNNVLLIEIKCDAELSGEDQLEKYCELLHNEYKEDQKYLIYLTLDICCPELPGQPSNTLKGKEFYWLSWYDLYDILRNNKANNGIIDEVSGDIIRLLENRSVMIFKGFGSYNSTPLKNGIIFWKQAAIFFSQYEKHITKTPIFWRGEEK